ncbi:unnamed protein product, partial [Ixodes hexagonus]
GFPSAASPARLDGAIRVAETSPSPAFPASPLRRPTERARYPSPSQASRRRLAASSASLGGRLIWLSPLFLSHPLRGREDISPLPSGSGRRASSSRHVISFSPSS